MALRTFEAVATTCEVSPGSERTDDAGRLVIEGRGFTDVVESDDPWAAGTNKLEIGLGMDPQTGSGELAGHFRLTPSGIEGTWEGELHGQLSGGVVSASGLATGSGALAGSVMHVAFQQVDELPGPAPCNDTIAFYRLNGLILPST